MLIICVNVICFVVFRRGGVIGRAGVLEVLCVVEVVSCRLSPIRNSTPQDIRVTLYYRGLWVKIYKLIRFL